MRTVRLIQRLAATIILAALVFLPTAVHAAGTAAQTSNSGSGVGIVLGLLALILILLAVVAVIGAVSLGIIGIGYNSIQGDD
ncbi:MAG: hypothetical protein P8183_06330 [Anaerolineae bacterium]|jgi:hypothetical protein